MRLGRLAGLTLSNTWHQAMPGETQYSGIRKNSPAILSLVLLGLVYFNLASIIFIAVLSSLLQRFSVHVPTTIDLLAYTFSLH